MLRPALPAYAGKPFGVMLTARNMAGSTTENYTGAFARTVLLEAGSAGNAHVAQSAIRASGQPA